MNVHLIIFGYVFAAICLIAIFLIFKNFKNIKTKDKLIIPQYNRIFKTPTWRFQKFHPNSCSHNNGIYRKIEVKFMDNIIKKNIFVCADCVDVIEVGN